MHASGYVAQISSGLRQTKLFQAVTVLSHSGVSYLTPPIWVNSRLDFSVRYYLIYVIVAVSVHLTMHFIPLIQDLCLSAPC